MGPLAFALVNNPLQPLTIPLSQILFMKMMVDMNGSLEMNLKVLLWLNLLALVIVDQILRKVEGLTYSFLIIIPIPI